MRRRGHAAGGQGRGIGEEAIQHHRQATGGRPEDHPYLIPSHLSAEKGAQIALDALGLRPYLDMDMRLGEG
ncbi:nicotinate-nucleotide--dimethylbenzimidazole phosphoribosyltransferase, partial [Klebsiella pneumoniae]|uniref:nicotinate-nucleotide--dimethylbenzimidazole phosphoribosyltransferase n=1 Tax=Klebsiella pneumoniae TaxID=573 RepID=UPI003A598A58